MFATKGQAFRVAFFDVCVIASTILQNSSTIFVAVFVGTENPSSAILFAPFLTDGLTLIQKLDRPLIIRALPLGYAFILFVIQTVFGEHIDAFKVLAVIGLTIIGVSLGEIVKERNPSPKNANTQNLLSALTEMVMGASLIWVMTVPITKLNLGTKIVSGICLVIGGIASTTGLSVYTSESQARYSITTNIGSHISEVFSSDFRHWGDALQLITGFIQIILGAINWAYHKDEVAQINIQGDPTPAELRLGH